MAQTSANLYQCCACAESKQKNEFSKKQRKKGQQRRCKICIDQNKEPMSKLQMMMSKQTTVSQINDMCKQTITKEKKVNQLKALKAKKAQELKEIKDKKQREIQALKDKKEKELQARKAARKAKGYNYISTVSTNKGNKTKNPDKNKIFKVGINETFYFGDGGEADMKWEIYASQKLYVNKHRMNNLKDDLIQIGLKNNDYRDNEPILNIIDPDLYVLKKYNKDLNHNKQSDQDPDIHIDYQAKQILMKGYAIRSEYQWLATEFKRNKSNNTVSLQTNIHNLSPRSSYTSVYKNIEYLFTSMIPLFKQFKIFDTANQVIIKSQRYEINNMSGYSGYWHQEGLTENIVLVGLYYFELTNGLTNGCLRFRNIRGPGNGYCRDKCLEYEIETKEGTTVVFDNVNLAHRVRMIKNKVNDNCKRYRSFIAFMIVDPDKPIESTKDYPSLKIHEYTEIIMKIIQCPLDVATLICEYGICGMTLDEAKKMREYDINLRKNALTRGRFGSVCWGNCGYSTFYHKGKSNKYSDIHYDNDWKATTNSELYTSNDNVNNVSNQHNSVQLADY